MEYRLFFTILKSSKAYLDKVNTIKIDFPLNPEIIAEKILYLSDNKEPQHEIIIKSRNLAKEKLNWKNESVKLFKAYLEALK